MSGFPSDKTLIYFFETNGIKNNLLTKRDMEICNKILARSKYASQEKTTMQKSESIDV